MSGEAAGIIIGGTILLGALPVIVGGVVLMGAAAAAKSAGENALKAAEERRRQHQLELDQCSRELSALYERVDAACDRQNTLSRQACEKMNQELQNFSAQLRENLREAGDADKINRLARQALQQTSHTLQILQNEELRHIREETEREMSDIMRDLHQVQQTRMEAADWTRQTQTAQAGQSAVARDLLRDAQASVRLLHTLARSVPDSAPFRQQAEIMERSCQRAEDALRSGQYQAAAAMSQKIVTESAVLVTEHEREQIILDELRVALSARLGGLKEQLASQAVVTFEDEIDGTREESLDAFTQGQFAKIQKQTDEMLLRLREDETLLSSETQMRLMLDDVENRLIPQAALITRTGQEKMMRYYERLHALEIIGGYMEKQGYGVDWVQPAGGDVTQKLVVRFREYASGNAVCVSLDEDADPEQAGKMAMEVLFYFRGGRHVSEQEKQAVRDGMTGALQAEGLNGSLSCTGSRGQEAADQTFNQQQAVRNLPPTPIFRTRPD